MVKNIKKMMALLCAMLMLSFSLCAPLSVSAEDFFRYPVAVYYDLENDTDGMEPKL